MKSCFSRLGLLAGLLGSFVLAPPSAHAISDASIVFIGTATVAVALDYTCAETVSITGPSTLPCPPGTAPVVSLVCDLPLNGTVTAVVPNCHPNFHHNFQPITFQSSQCIGASVNIAKAKSPVEGPTCTLSIGGIVSGWCDLNGGFARGEVTVGGNPYNVDVHFTTIADGTAVTGHYTKSDGHHGLVTGIIHLDNPTVILTPGQSCLVKTARDFLIESVLSFVPEPVL